VDVTVTATLVAGAPCSGKNTYVREHMAPGDLVVDYDAIMSAFSGQDVHDHEPNLRPYVYEARDRVLKKWESRRDVDLWLIFGAPKRTDRDFYARRGFRVVIMDTDERTCLRRARDDRPADWYKFVHRWFRDYEAPLSSEEVQQASDAPPLAHVSRRW
jgi:hypothetical protein